MIVVADTSPVNYLLLIDCIDLLPQLYGQVVVPSAVQEELLDAGAPTRVRSWIKHPPPWLLIRAVDPSRFSSTELGAGEAEAIALAQQLKADYLVMDESLGRLEAAALGLKVIGTLGILQRAHLTGLIDLRTTVDRLRETNFRISNEIVERLLRQMPK